MIKEEIPLKKLLLTVINESEEWDGYLDMHEQRDKTFDHIVVYWSMLILLIL